MLSRPLTRPLSSPLDTAQGRGLPWEEGGGSGAPWTPAQLTSLKLWLKGGVDMVQVAGPKISDWGDQSAVGNDFTQATDANRPGVATVRNTAVPDFDGSASRMATAGLLSSMFSASAYTVLIAAQADTVTGTSGSPWLNQTLFSDVGVGDLYCALVSSGGLKLQVGHFDGTSSKIVTASGVTTAQPMLIEWTLSGGTLSGRVDAGTAVTATSVGNVRAAALAATVRVGSSYNAGVGSNFDGKLLEVVVCNAALSAGDITQARQYMSRAWGMAV